MQSNDIDAQIQVQPCVCIQVFLHHFDLQLHTNMCLNPHKGKLRDPPLEISNPFLPFLPPSPPPPLASPPPFPPFPPPSPPSPSKELDGWLYAVRWRLRSWPSWPPSLAAGSVGSNTSGTSNQGSPKGGPTADGRNPRETPNGIVIT